MTPAPYTQPHPMLFYGGGSLAAAKRAARLGLHFQPQVGGPELKAAYEEECRAAGSRARLHPPRAARAGERLLRRGPGRASGSGTASTCWPTRRRTPRGGRDTSSYVLDDSSTVEEMRAAGVYVVLTADDLVDRCRAGEIRLVTSHPACGGLPAEPSWEC